MALLLLLIERSSGSNCLACESYKCSANCPTFWLGGGTDVDSADFWQNMVNLVMEVNVLIANMPFNYRSAVFVLSRFSPRPQRPRYSLPSTSGPISPNPFLPSSAPYTRNVVTERIVFNPTKTKMDILAVLQTRGNA